MRGSKGIAKMAMTICPICTEKSEVLIIAKSTAPKYLEEVEKASGKVIGLENCRECIELSKDNVAIIFLREDAVKEVGNLDNIQIKNKEDLIKMLEMRDDKYTWLPREFFKEGSVESERMYMLTTEKEFNSEVEKHNKKVKSNEPTA